ncbi:hypothetical protein V8G57_18725 [Collimonas sp. H4R21]|jgi:hypothetical protein|uniref:Lipoprotein n=1 Tax=Collimonas rhizosphaerae TaxID=3126357 RepID=A0ABU9PZI5_9BURK|nr:hypothetical protein [Collimonas sp. OK412]SFC47493.1 hypothetical protein SAMN04515619_10866 [Collimonas sp. OK412]
MKKRLLIGATLLGATMLLGGCVAYPYAGDPYYGGYGGYYGGGYYAPAPVYVGPSVDIGFGYSRGWGGRGWGGRGWGGGWHGGH